jgi:hypothetical protein
MQFPIILASASAAEAPPPPLWPSALQKAQTSLIPSTTVTQIRCDAEHHVNLLGAKLSMLNESNNNELFSNLFKCGKRCTW